MKEFIYKISPNFIQNSIISIYNCLAYRRRYGGKYYYYFSEFRKNNDKSYEELSGIQEMRLKEFVKAAIEKSNFYRDLYSNYNIEDIETIDDLDMLPIVNKEMLRSSMDNIYTVSASNGVIAKTGGTTGKSLVVRYTKENSQERIAMLDNFRFKFNYKLGKKTAWFSGKNLLTATDIKRKQFWKTDYLYNIRYYSTFHIKDGYLKYYVENLINFEPEYLSGFPSTIFDIAKYGLKNGYDFPAETVKAVFPTAETITKDMRFTIESFFKTKLYDQYASSEGAPFIFECEKNNLHLELQSGVFEVLDQNDQPTKSGRLVVTSFTTEGTPLIRYDIGDSITLDDPHKKCSCGNNNPMVLEILGRINDYVFSPENGKINIVNVANAIKDVKGIITYQIIQNELEKIEFKIIIDREHFNDVQERLFLSNWRDRLGEKMKLELNYVSDIPVEKSGKFRIIKNNIKHLI